MAELPKVHKLGAKPSEALAVAVPGSLTPVVPHPLLAPGSSQSSHTSKYFGSVESSEAEAGAARAGAEPGEQVIKYVLQDPIWLLMANADQRVMMTYQVPSR